ncbi:hypothetical protein MJ8_25620 [Mesorhizobium sp. J8]|nr:hypothetical protein MJ8_25620 [Mesorhizobium sp. J8]
MATGQPEGWGLGAAGGGGAFPRGSQGHGPRGQGFRQSHPFVTNGGRIEIEGEMMIGGASSPLMLHCVRFVALRY